MPRHEWHAVKNYHKLLDAHLFDAKAADPTAAIMATRTMISLYYLKEKSADTARDREDWFRRRLICSSIGLSISETRSLCEFRCVFVLPWSFVNDY